MICIFLAVKFDFILRHACWPQQADRVRGFLSTQARNHGHGVLAQISRSPGNFPFLIKRAGVHLRPSCRIALLLSFSGLKSICIQLFLFAPIFSSNHWRAIRLRHNQVRASIYPSDRPPRWPAAGLISPHLSCVFFVTSAKPASPRFRNKRISPPFAPIRPPPPDRASHRCRNQST